MRKSADLTLIECYTAQEHSLGKDLISQLKELIDRASQTKPGLLIPYISFYVPVWSNSSAISYSTHEASLKIEATMVGAVSFPNPFGLFI